MPTDTAVDPLKAAADKAAAVKAAAEARAKAAQEAAEKAAAEAKAKAEAEAAALAQARRESPAALDAMRAAAGALLTMAKAFRGSSNTRPFSDSVITTTQRVVTLLDLVKPYDEETEPPIEEE